MSCPEFVAKTMALRTSIHMAHLLSPSYAKHVALQDFYEGVVGHADRLAEIHMAEAGRVPFPNLKPETGTPEALLTAYLAATRAELKDEKGQAAKETVLADIEELTLRTLYKLRTFP